MSCFLWLATAGRRLVLILVRGGVSFVEMLILCELWAGERLVLEKAVHRYRRPGRPILVSAVLFGPGTDIWHSCRFIGALPGHCVVITAGFGSLVGRECGHGPSSVLCW